MPPITNLHLASSIPIETALSNLSGSFNARNAWLNVAGNKYIVDTLGELGRDINSGRINDAQVIDYLASSVFIHCFNGWSYLSAALHSFLEGDYANAIHNAYYAELRSIISFLNSQGIGVFNYNNVIVDASGVVHRASGSQGTHIFAKVAFDQWLNSHSNANSLLNLFTVNNNSLDQWFNATGFPASTYMPAQLMSQWFQSWSLDLNIIKLERDFRNFVSYNPQCFDLSIVRLSDNIRSRLEFVIDLWKLCAPTNFFENSILRRSLETLYHNIFGYRLSDLDVTADWGEILGTLGMDPQLLNNQQLIKFLRKDIEPDDNSVFNYAQSIRPSTPLLESDTDPMGIISRACLTLLINTKILESLLRRTGVTKANLKFWFDNIGLKFGYWDVANEPYVFSDLWDEIRIQTEDIFQWINSPGTVFSPYNAKQNLQNKGSNICHLNKAYLWRISA